MNQIVRFFK